MPETLVEPRTSSIRGHSPRIRVKACITSAERRAAIYLNLQANCRRAIIAKILIDNAEILADIGWTTSGKATEH
jgi:hypothetical protein